MSSVYRLKVEDRNLQPIDGYDVFHSRRAAIAAFNAVVVDPDPDLGSVYLTADDGDDEVVVLGHYFVDVGTA